MVLKKKKKFGRRDQQNKKESAAYQSKTNLLKVFQDKNTLTDQGHLPIEKQTIKKPLKFRTSE